MPFQLKSYDIIPEALKGKFNPAVLKRFGIFFKNAVPVVKAHPEHFDKIPWYDYDRAIGEGTSYRNYLNQSLTKQQ